MHVFNSNIELAAERSPQGYKPLPMGEKVTCTLSTSLSGHSLNSGVGNGDSGATSSQ